MVIDYGLLKGCRLALILVLDFMKYMVTAINVGVMATCDVAGLFRQSEVARIICTATAET